MARKKEPTESYFTVIVEKHVLMQARVACKVTARLDKTKKRLIGNSAEDLTTRLRDDEWVEIDDGIAEVVEIGDYDGYIERCPHCDKTVREPPILDLGEVAD